MGCQFKRSAWHFGAWSVSIAPRRNRHDPTMAPPRLPSRGDALRRLDLQLRPVVLPRLRQDLLRPWLVLRAEGEGVRYADARRRAAPRRCNGVARREEQVGRLRSPADGGVAGNPGET